MLRKKCNVGKHDLNGHRGNGRLADFKKYGEICNLMQYNIKLKDASPLKES